MTRKAGRNDKKGKSAQNYKIIELTSTRNFIVHQQSNLGKGEKEPLRRSGTANAKPETKICVNRPIQPFSRVLII